MAASGYRISRVKCFPWFDLEIVFNFSTATYTIAKSHEILPTKWEGNKKKVCFFDVDEHGFEIDNWYSVH